MHSMNGASKQIPHDASDRLGGRRYRLAEVQCMIHS